MMRKILLSLFILFHLITNAQNELDKINLLIINSKYEEAIQLSNQIEHRYTTNAEYYFQKALLFKLMYKYPQAIQSISSSIELDPNNVDYLSEYGFILSKAEKIKESREIFESIIQKNPYNLKVGIALSNMYLKERKFENAEKLLIQLFEVDTLNSYIARNIGISKYFQGDSLSINWLKKTIYLDSTDIKACKYLFSAYVAKEDFEKAFPVIEKAKQIDPDNKSLYLTEGDIHVLRNHNFRAIPVYLKAFELDPADEELPRKIGLCYYKIKKYDLAKSYLLLADKRSLNLDVYKHLGYIYKRNNNPDSSNYYFTKALDILTPDNNMIFRICVDIAENYYHLENYNHSVGWYDRAINLELKGIWSRSMKNKALIDIAAIYADKLNNKEKALEYFTKVTNDTTFFMYEEDYYKYAQQRITKLKEELFFEGEL